MKELSKIHDEFYAIDPRLSTEFVEYYERNSTYFDNKKDFSSNDEFDFYSLVCARHVMGLEKMGRYRKTIKYGNMFKLIMTNNKKHIDDLDKFNYYWSILASQGRSHYNLKDYKKAIEVFKKLTKWDKENDQLNNWLKASKFAYKNRFSNHLYVLAWITLLVAILIEDRFVSKGIIIIGLILILYNVIISFLADRKIKWSENNF